MTLFSTIVTLIAAWMKKQQYIERINIIDRYNQKLNKLIEKAKVEYFKNTNVNGGMDWLEIAYQKVKEVLCQS